MKYLSFFIILIAITFETKSQVITPDIEENIPMRDSKSLAADIYIPDGGNGNSYPVILIQTPYNRLMYRYGNGLPLGIGNNIALSNYAVVIVDWRCFYGSQGACIAQPNRGQDGYDVIEWIAQQTWSNGKIGTWGPSALGKIQFQSAREHPPHYTCAVPIVAAPQFNYLEYYEGGVYKKEYIEQLDGLGYGMSSTLLAHPYFDNIWTYMESTNYYPDEIEIPCFMIGGWYDHNVNVMLDMYNGLQAESPINSHKLLMGPWTHGGNGQSDAGNGMQGALSFAQANGYIDSLSLMFFDFYLRDIPNQWDTISNVQYFQIGENNWQVADSWPVDNTQTKRFYLQPNNLLAEDMPISSNHYYEYTYNPNDPSPTIGGATLRADLLQGPYNQADEVENRNDIILFSTSELTQNVTFKGSLKVYLFISSDKKDTDFAVRFTDVYPDGTSMLINNSIKRMRFRNGYTINDTAFMIPENIYEVEIELPDVAYTFLQNHKIRIAISSSNYPMYEINLNNGGEMNDGSDTLIATNKIYTNSQYPSYIEMPLVDYVSGIDKKMKKTNIAIFPNPTQNAFSINCKSTEFEKIEIYNINGACIKTWQNYKTNYSIKELDNGIYFVKVYTNKGKGSHTIKILKQ